jgi:hypothetical protein
VDLSHLRQLMQAGMDALCWRDGMGAWAPLADVL